MLGIAAISIGVGLVLCVIGWRGGGVAYASDTHSEYYSNNSYFTEVEGVTSLDFNIPFGNVQICIGESFSLWIEGIEEDGFKSKVKNGKWEVSVDKDFEFVQDVIGGRFWNFLKWFRDGDNTYTDYPFIQITIPKNATLKNSKICVGAGEVYIEDLTTKTAELEIETGSMILSHFTASKSIDIEVETGSFYLDSGTLNNMKLECEVGEASLYGDITGKSSVDCGVGNVTITLEKEEKDYYYTVDCGIGSVIINDRSYKDNSKIGKKDSEHRIDLECGVGEICIWNDTDRVIEEVFIEQELENEGEWKDETWEWEYEREATVVQPAVIQPRTDAQFEER